MTEAMNLGKLIIRRAQEEDLESVKRLEDRVFSPGDRFSKRRLRYLISSPNSYTILCSHGPLPVGYGIALKNRLRNESIKGRVYSLAVAPEWRHRGVGKLLMDHLEGWLAGSGATFITLEAHGWNRRAIQFYRKRGYHVVDTLPGYYPAGDGLRFRRAI
jgi:ribosomal protein S18 acetylase RimI-like enzyme